jgi:hypothetical protein
MACTRERTIFVAPPPLAVDHQSVVYVVTVDAQPVEGFAWAVADGPPRIDLPADPESSTIGVYALLYAQTLECLGLSSGKIEVGGELRLVPPDGLAVATIVGDAATFEPTTALPEKVEALLMRSSGCHPLTATALPIPGTQTVHPRFVVPIDHTRALVGLQDGRFFTFSGPALEPLALPPTLPHDGALTDDVGTIWLVDRFGRLANGTIDAGFTMVSTSTVFEAGITPASYGSEGARIWVAGGGFGSSFEVFVFAPPAGLFRWQRGSWAQLDARSMFHESVEPGIARLSADDVLMIGLELDEISHFRGGVLKAEALDAFEFSQPSSILVHPRLGSIAGSRNGSLYRRSPNGAWPRLEGSKYDRTTQLLAPFRDAILYGGINGVLAQLHEGDLHCDPIALTPNRLRGYAPIDDDLLVITGPSETQSDEPATIVRITASRDPTACAQ